MSESKSVSSPEAMIRVLAAAVFSATTLCTASLAGQEPVALEDCRSACGLELTAVADLGDSAGDGFVGLPQSLVRRLDGSFLLADRYDQAAIKRFSPSGAYLGSIGRRGQGPGEFQIVQKIFPLRGDTFEVYDLRTKRITRFDPSFEVISTSLLRAAGPELVRLSDTAWVTYLGWRTPERAGLPLTLVYTDEGIGPSFGSDPPVSELSTAHLYRFITRADQDLVWSAPLTEYSLELWSVAGERLRQLVRPVDWFEPNDGPKAPSPEVPPSPRVAGIHLDEQGLLWVLVWISDAEWGEGIGTGTGPYGEDRPMVDDENRFFDTVIEVIDPVEARVVKRRRVDEAIHGFADDGYVYSLHEHHNLEPYIRVWRVEPTR